MKLRSIYLVNLFLALSVFGLLSCEGPEGPLGPQGEQGDKGDPGANGQDASLYCASCHNLETRKAKELQFASSIHSSMPTAARATTADCAMCHSHQGYVETTFTGQSVPAVAPAFPMPLQCESCHDSHQGYVETTFTGQSVPAVAPAFPMPLQCESCHDSHVTMKPEEGPDYALRYTKPVKFLIGDKTIEHDFPGTANSCAFCHQPRTQPGWPLDPTKSDLTHNITSSRYGPHHSSQSTLLIGKFGYEVSGGGQNYANSKHSDQDCSFCHMIAEPKDSQLGGHTFLVDEQTCNDCHAGKVDLEEIRTEVSTLLAELKGLLAARGLLNASTDLAITTHTSTGALNPANPLQRAWTNDEAGVFYNYKFIEEDQSMGIHNPKYTIALLKNSIAKLKAK